MQWLINRLWGFIILLSTGIVVLVVDGRLESGWAIKISVEIWWPWGWWRRREKVGDDLEAWCSAKVPSRRFRIENLPQPTPLLSTPRHGFMKDIRRKEQGRRTTLWMGHHTSWCRNLKDATSRKSLDLSGTRYLHTCIINEDYLTARTCTAGCIIPGTVPFITMWLIRLCYAELQSQAQVYDTNHNPPWTTQQPNKSSCH